MLHSETTVLVHAEFENSHQETDNIERPSPSPRRKKKNKYDQFSKVRSESDPFDELVAASYQKVKELEEEMRLRRRQRNKPTAQLSEDFPSPPKVNFPDTKDIDPYDPSTFGYVEIGHITGAHGVNGWLKVQSTTGFPVERLCKAGIRHLKPKQKRAPRQIVLVQGKHRVDDEYLVELEDVTDRETALKLRGSTLYVRDEDKIESSHDGDVDGEEEYLLSDLVGLEVRMNDSTQSVVGIVNGLVLAEEMCAIPELGHDTLEVRLQKGPVPSYRDELVLIPLVKQIVTIVDISNGFLVIDPPAGLLELTYVRTERVRLKGFLPSTQTNDDVG